MYPLRFHSVDPERGAKDFDDGSEADSKVHKLRQAIHAEESEDRNKEGCGTERGRTRSRLRLCSDALLLLLGL